MAHQSIVGDAPPPALAALFTGRVDEALADDILYAFWDGTGEETAPRTVAEGADAVRRVFSGRTQRPEVLVCLQEDRDCFVEGVLVDEAAPAASFIAGYTLNGDGLIERILAYHSTPIDPSATWAGELLPSPADALDVLDRYFDHLHAARFPEAVACFTEDCLYSHPPYSPGTPRANFRGHAELLAGFEKRGPSAWTHDIVASVQRGPECLFEGVVPDVPGGGSFISSLSLAEDGRIRRYAAFYSSPMTPRR